MRKIIFALALLLGSQASASTLYAAYECTSNEELVARILLDESETYFVQVGEQKPRAMKLVEGDAFSGSYRAGNYVFRRNLGTGAASLTGGGLALGCYVLTVLPNRRYPF